MLILKSACAVLLVIVASACGSSTTTSPSPAAPQTCPSPPSGIFTLNDNETLRMAFRVSATPTTDVMVTDVGLVSAPTSATSSWRVLNGSNLLGTQQGATGVAFWRSSVSQFSNGTTIDFSSLLNGTIDGRVEFAVTKGPFQLDLSKAIVGIAHAFSSNGFSVLVNPVATLTLISSSCR